MVNFVGAGPGAVDLITVRGMRLIAEADVIIYAGSLVNPELLNYAKSSCEVHNSASMTLEQVVSVMKRAEAEKLSTVRLHTGDPSIYGAIKEQMDVLDSEGISYSITPGVSSFCGAAASLKTEYTLPGVSQTVILTRMEGRTPMPEREKLESLAAHGSTMVLFLTSSLIDIAVNKLLLGGYKRETPAAIVYKASWPDEKLIRTTLEGLSDAARENGITKTALIIVGDTLSGEYQLSRLYSASFSHEFREAENF